MCTRARVRCVSVCIDSRSMKKTPRLVPYIESPTSAIFLVSSLYPHRRVCSLQLQLFPPFPVLSPSQPLRILLYDAVPLPSPRRRLYNFFNAERNCVRAGKLVARDHVNSNQHRFKLECRSDRRELQRELQRVAKVSCESEMRLTARWIRSGLTYREENIVEKYLWSIER